MLRAFVIMPFAADYEPVFRNVIQPALDGYEILRADTRFDERGILEKIVTGIADADLVVADITGTNANVMYELGVAHTLNKPTIMIARSVSNLPFDIRSYPVHEYSTDTSRDSPMAGHLGALAARHRDGLVRFANPVCDFLSRSARGATQSRPHNDLRSEREVAAQINERAEEINWASDAVSKYFADFQELCSRYTERLEQATALVRQEAGSTPRGNLGMRASASETRQFAVQLDTLSHRFHEIWERLGRAMLWLISPEQRQYISLDQARKFADGSKSSDARLDDMLAELAELRHVISSFPNWSGNLTQALEAANIAISRHLNEIMTAKAYIRRIQDGASESA